MPTYRITDPTTGRKVKITGDVFPTEQELDEIFASYNKPAMEPQPPMQEPAQYKPPDFAQQIQQVQQQSDATIALPKQIGGYSKNIPMSSTYIGGKHEALPTKFAEDIRRQEEFDKWSKEPGHIAIPEEEAAQITPLTTKLSSIPKAIASGSLSKASSELLSYGTGLQSPFNYVSIEKRDKEQQDLYKLGEKVQKNIDSGKTKNTSVKGLEFSALQYYKQYKNQEGAKKISEDVLKPFGDNIVRFSEGIDEAIPKEWKMSAQDAQKMVLSKESWNLDRLKEDPFHAVKLITAMLTTTAEQAPNTLVSMAGSFVPYAGPVIAANDIVRTEAGGWIKEAKTMGIGDPEILKKYSMVYGVPSGIVELGTDMVITAPLTAAAKGIAPQAAKKAIQGAVNKMIVVKLAANVGKTVGSGIMEGVEELGQGTISSLVLRAALEEMAKKYPDKKDYYLNKIQELDTKVFSSENINSFIIGAISGTLTGGAARVGGGVITEISEKKQKTTERLGQEINRIRDENISSKKVKSFDDIKEKWSTIPENVQDEILLELTESQKDELLGTKKYPPGDAPIPAPQISRQPSGEKGRPDTQPQTDFTADIDRINADNAALRQVAAQQPEKGTPLTPQEPLKPVKPQAIPEQAATAVPVVEPQEVKPTPEIETLPNTSRFKEKKQKEAENAKEIRGNERPVQEGGVVPEVGKGKGGEDIQQPAETGGAKVAPQEKVVSRETLKAQVPNKILNPTIAFDEDIKAEQDPEKKNRLERARDRIVDPVIEGVYKNEDAWEVAKYCEQNNLPCAIIRGDGRELKAWNTKNKNVHADTDAEIKQIWGDVYSKRIREAGGIMTREQGDEFLIALPGYTAREAADFMENVEKEASVVVKKLGLDAVPSAKKEFDGLPTGTGIIDFGVSDLKNGKYGETDRAADNDLTARKIKKLIDKAKENGYIVNKDENGKVIGFTKGGRNEHGKTTSQAGIRDEHGGNLDRTDEVRIKTDSRNGKGGAENVAGIKSEAATEKEVVSEKQVAVDLIESKTNEEINKKLDSIFGNIPEERLAELDDGADFKNDDEKINYELSTEYRADLERAANDRDYNETEKIYKEIKVHKELVKRESVSSAGRENINAKTGTPRKVRVKKEPSKTPMKSAIAEVEKLINDLVDTGISPDKIKLKAHIAIKQKAKKYGVDVSELGQNIWTNYYKSWTNKQKEKIEKEKPPVESEKKEKKPETEIPAGKKYVIQKNKITHSMSYGVSSVPVTFENAYNVKIPGRKDVTVYLANSGWIVYDKESHYSIGKKKAGLGWIGFNTKKEAVENYINIKNSDTKFSKPLSEFTKENPITFNDAKDIAKARIPQELWDKCIIRLQKTPGDSQGAIYVANSVLVVDINPDTPPSRLVRVLFHDIMGHAGAANVLKTNDKIYKRLNALYNTSTAKIQKKSILNSYKDKFDKRRNEGATEQEIENELFAEWIAHNVEKYLATKDKQGLAYQVWKAIKDFLIDMGWKEDSIDEAIGKLVKEIRRTKNFEATIGIESENMFSKGEIKADTFFSPTLRAVENLKQERGTGEQMFNMITKTPGVKEAEWKWMGLDDFLKGKPSATKAEIEDFVRQNQVEIKEVSKERGKVKYYPKNSYMHPQTGDVDTYENWASATEDFSEEGGKTKEEQLDTLVDVSGKPIDNEDLPDPTKFSSYQLPGGENYREVLLMLPVIQERSDVSKMRDKHQAYSDRMDNGEKLTDAEQKDYESNLMKLEATGPNPYLETKRGYKSSHWSELNVIAHIRMNDRTGPSGEKVLFVEEIQSDWEREAREKGVNKTTEQLVSEIKDRGWKIRDQVFDRTKPSIDPNNQGYQAYLPGTNQQTAVRKTEKEAWESLISTNDQGVKHGVPNQPFLKNWEELLLKRILRLAAEEGYDRVAWINGEQTADRYDLSKQVDEIQWGHNKNGTYQIVPVKDGIELKVFNDVKPDRIAEIIGKDVSKKIIDASNTAKNGSISGEGLKIGGEWAHNLYDVRIPQFLEKYGKKWGAKVERVEIGKPNLKPKKPLSSDEKNRLNELSIRSRTPEEHAEMLELSERNDDRLGVEDKNTTNFHGIQQSIRITEEMRQSVMYEGQPMFAKELEKEKFKKWFGNSKIVDENGNPLVVYHSTYDYFTEFKREVLGKSTKTNTDNKAAHNLAELGFWHSSKDIEVGNQTQANFLKIENPKHYYNLNEDAWYEASNFDSSEEWMDELKNDGYDGIIIDNDSEFGGTSYVVFEPSQIKSAIGNIGTFDSENKDIRFAKELQFDPTGIPVESTMDKIRQKVQDRFLRLERLQKALNPNIREEMDARLAQELYNGRAEARLNEFEDKHFKPLRGKIAASKIKVDELEDFLYAQHAAERNEHIKNIRPKETEGFLTEQEMDLLNRANEIGYKKAGEPDAVKVEKYDRQLEGIVSELKNLNVKKEKIIYTIAGSGMFTTKADKDAAIETYSALDNEELLKEIKEMPVAEEILNRFKEEGKTDKLESFASTVYDITDRVRNVLLSEGLIDEETKKAWESYEFYVPLRGIKDKEQTARTGRGFDIRGKESKRALGRRSKAENILANIIVQANEAIVRAEKNRVGKAFLNFVNANPNEDLWVVDEAKKSPFFNENTGEVEYRIDPKYRRAKNIMSVKVNGKEYHITIKDNTTIEENTLAKAMVNLGSERSNKVLQGLSMLNRYFALINTSMVPEFVLTNMSRDLQTAMINSGAEYDIKTAANILKNVPVSIKWVWEGESGKKTEGAKWYNEYKQSGGKIGFFGLESVDDVSARLKNELALMEGGTKSNIINGTRSAVKFIMKANNAVENAARLSTYIEMRKKGMSKSKAASVARNITVDFNKSGELGQYFKALFVFSNASIQGTTRVLKSLKNPRTQKIVAGIVVGSIALAELGRAVGGKDDDDEYFYDKIPGFIKQNNIIFMSTTGKIYFKIPVPYGFNIFHAFGQTFDYVIHNNKKGDFLKAAADVSGAVGNSFNPLGSVSNIWQMFTPTAIRPIADISLNKNFMGSPVYKVDKYGVPKSKSETHFKGTSIPAQKISTGLNVATGGGEYEKGLVDIPPDIIDYVFDYYTGGLGRTLKNAISLPLKIGTKKDITINEIPFVRRFVGEVSEYQDINTFYENVNSAETIRKEYEAKKLDHPSQAPRYYEKNKDILILTTKMPIGKNGQNTTPVNKMEQKIRELRKTKDALEKSEKLDLAKKYDDRILALIKSYNLILNKTGK